ncbi:F0F1 ATP synthase subunit B [Loigolactobacillus backii]|uniref:ATP synthase subunit b n=1 Tax=Loigolactobacillus backii TaxID=375175 RepID=A0A192H4P0_9LACO|nr:F0F1 ATP synthase subunit B [Loigolactobacillus backii]ANK63213.1 F0F1 ATP synthase subunit B [Loigolactobacillus backii]ANK69781.1 F0F1 ATP synthase subunit B [Loigolactobacillus backii]MDA5387600.1 F0F1 ATP synthase subunit B [Loigolactobacillus backii]MDA5390154.1 F0F1 ATP synthase subunit B [Loigolactobacillus backii]
MLSHFVVGAASGLYIGDLLFYLISFILLLLLIKHFAWGPVTKMMENRATKISSDLDYAEDSRTKASSLQAQRQKELDNSQQEATDIVNDARQNGEKQRQTILSTAQDEVGTLKSNAQKDIAQEREDALKSAQNDVAALSIEIASKIIQKELKADDQKALIDSYIEGLGKQNGAR